MTNNKSQNNNEPVYNNRIGYRTRIGFSQSLSSGIIAIDGSIQYDYADEAQDCIKQLVHDMKLLEIHFVTEGYRVAKTIEPKEVKPKEKENSRTDTKGIIISKLKKSKKVTE